MGLFDDEDGLLGGPNVVKAPKPRRMRAGFRSVERKTARTPMKRREIRTLATPGAAVRAGEATKVAQPFAAIRSGAATTMATLPAAPALSPGAAPSISTAKGSSIAPAVIPTVKTTVAANTPTGLFSSPTPTAPPIVTTVAPKPAAVTAAVAAPVVQAPTPAPAISSLRFRALSGLFGIGEEDGQLPAEGPALALPDGSTVQTVTEPDPTVPDAYGIPLSHRPGNQAWISEDLWSLWPDGAVPTSNGVRWKHRIAYPKVDAGAGLFAELAAGQGADGEGFLPAWLGGSAGDPNLDPLGSGFAPLSTRYLLGQKKMGEKGRISPLDGRDLDWSSAPPRVDSLTLSLFGTMWRPDLSSTVPAPGFNFTLPRRGDIPGYSWREGFAHAPMQTWSPPWPADLQRADLSDGLPDTFSPWGYPVDLIAHYVAGDIPDGQGPGWRAQLGEYLKNWGWVPGAQPAIVTVPGHGGAAEPRQLGFPVGIGTVTVYNPDGSDYAALLGKGMLPLVPTVTNNGPSAPAQSPVQDVPPVNLDVGGDVAQAAPAEQPTDVLPPDASGMLPGPSGDFYEDPGAGLVPYDDGGQVVDFPAGVSPGPQGIPAPYYAPDYDESGWASPEMVADERQIIADSIPVASPAGALPFGDIPGGQAEEFYEYFNEWAPGDEFATPAEDEAIGMLPWGFDMEEPTAEDGPIPIDEVRGWGERGY